MNGVTVIAEHTVKNVTADDYLTAIMCGLFALILSLCVLAIICIAIEEVKDWGKPELSTVLLFIFCVGLCAILACTCTRAIKRIRKGDTHKEYTVTLDESASYLEFTEKYEVLSEEDGVYRVREKNDDNI